MSVTYTFKWEGDGAVRGAEQGARQGLQLAAEHLLGKARAIVPIDTGALSRSGRAEVASDGQSASVSFDTPYAVRQHENLHYRHKPGRQAKYLETPLRTEASTIQNLIATALRRHLR